MKYIVKDIANIRLTPGYINKDNYDVVGATSVGTIIESDESLEKDGLIWIKSEKGWIAKTSPDNSIILEAITIKLHYPVDVGTPISQTFGENPEFYKKIPGYPVPLLGHNGLDFGLSIGSNIYAADTGEVLFAEFDNTGFGNMIRLRHSWGETLYAHLSEILIGSGNIPLRGSLIAKSGNTGLGTGPHLHFGVRIYPYDRADGWGGYSNPELYL